MRALRIIADRIRGVDLAAALASPAGLPTEALLARMGEGRARDVTRAERPQGWVAIEPSDAWGYADTEVRHHG